MGMDPADDTEDVNPEVNASRIARKPLKRESRSTSPMTSNLSRRLLAIVEEHRHLHIPYRDCCKFCVLGRGNSIQHRRSEYPVIARIGLDYFYITAGDVKIKSEFEYAGDGEGNASLHRVRND